MTPKRSNGAAAGLKPRVDDRQHTQDLLDEALDETFPASDPLAMLEPSYEAAEDEIATVQPAVEPGKR